MVSYKNEINYAENVIDLEGGGHKIYLLVDGIFCGSCVWLIENALNSIPYIKAARITVSTNRLEILWDGSKELVTEMANLVARLGYQVSPFNLELVNDQEVQKEKDMLKAIAVAGFATAQIMALALAVWIGNYNHSMGEYLRCFLHIVSGIIAIPTILYASRTFIQSALNGIKQRRMNIDIPISIGIITTLLISVQETLRMSNYAYYDAAASLTFLLLVGRYLDLKAKNKARAGIRAIMFQQPNIAYVVREGNIVCIAANAVKEDDIVLVKPGEKFPVDGTITEGESEVDNSLISGETSPIHVRRGSYVYAGTINLNRSIKLKVEKTGDQTTVAEILRLIENIEKSKSKFVNIADKISQYFTPTIISLAILTFCIWFFQYHDNFFNSTLHAVSLLIITCPCAIGIAVPMVQIVSFSKLIKQGIFLKTSDALERFNQVNTIVFDKTGTLTAGAPTLLNFDDFSNEARRIVASMAAKSNHILCKAITDKFDEDIFDLEVTEVKGEGLYAKSGNDEFWLGKKSWCKIEDQGQNKDSYLEIWYRKNQEEPRRLIFKDELRKEVKKVIEALKERYDVILLSGDRNFNVTQTANVLGIKQFWGEKNFQDKHAFIAKLTSEGRKVLMVGDGLNDALALKTAFASISPKTSIAISQNATDALYNGNLNSISTILKVARSSIIRIKQNFVLSVIYNCLAIPIAMMGMANPIIAAIFMSLSSITVIFNSLRRY
ncbi:heavy metal translocating P-type ATPase [Candidatus Bandiella euplotis]|uniref:heavy metal translocating P-type ATPase n=1 Tax=Candidatus Bandiella euplotis TaxID=1664265 RepID=UPI002B260DC1|nr:cation-translocating P-type ATPase [Candidatus Bandiella woodruffii]